LELIGPGVGLLLGLLELLVDRTQGRVALALLGLERLACL
jgi:hypothetical protein